MTGTRPRMRWAGSLGVVMAGGALLGAAPRGIHGVGVTPPPVWAVASGPMAAASVLAAPVPAAHPAAAVQSRRPRRASRAAPAARLPYRTPRGVDALADALKDYLGGHTRGGNWGALVVSLSRGDTLFAHAADRPMQPASTMKLFTAALALDALGPNHSFRTEVLRDGPLDAQGVVRGNLILRGDGDPSLSPRFVRGGLDAPMALVAELTAGAGVRRVTGDLIADASAFERRGIPEGWLTRYAGASYAAPFSALSLNDNLVVVRVTPGAPNAPPQVDFEPATEGLVVVNTARTVAGRGGRLVVHGTSDHHILVAGTIGAGSAPRRTVVVAGSPPRFAAGAFRAALAARGITVDGTIRLGAASPLAASVATLASPPLDRLVAVMNRESVNLYAEQLWRAAARGKGGVVEGSATTANDALQQFLTQRVGTPPGTVRAADGSGLSVLDRVTPRALVQLLGHAHRAPWGTAFHASLPVAGESELLQRRMRSTPAQGNLHAKTGTTSVVVGLSGYVTAEDGEVLAFAFLYNGSDLARAREAIDAMGPTMASFSR
jgi:D-alanyl-D-alanine carboxypeptidase/D-alanyl-D-alanine-endopeptidase (penicillin-binding protein 4)